MANFGTMAEGFETLDSKWTVAGTVTADGELSMPQSANLTFSPAIKTSTTWGLDTSMAAAPVIEISPFVAGVSPFLMFTSSTTTSNGFYLVRSADGNSYIYRSQSSGSIFGGGTVTTTDRFWKFHYSFGETRLYGSSSSDGSTGWTQRFSWNVSNSETGFSFTYTSVYLHLKNIGTTSGSVFRGINEPQATQVTAVVATASVEAPVPSVSTVRVGVPVMSAMIEVLIPEILAPNPVMLSPPVATAVAVGVVPDEVIAPAPTGVTAVAARATASAPTPLILEILNTQVFTPKAAANIEMLPPGEYIRISAPAGQVLSTSKTPRRVGPTLSEYAATVVQDETNYGGALAYYRLSDETSTLQDDVSGFNGGWSGTKALIPGAIVDDPDTAVYFNGTNTRGMVGILPTLNVPADDPAGLAGNVDPWGTGTYRTGAGVGFWFYCPEGMTAERYLLSFSLLGSATNTTLTVRVAAGKLIARIYQTANNWTELVSALPVNDGDWHFGFISTGRVLGDETPGGNVRTRLYLDGSLTSQINTDSMSWYGDLVIGALTGSSTSGLWEGGIDDVALYDYAPSFWEVLEQWNQGQQLTGPGLRMEPPPATVESTLVTPTTRRSEVRPLNEFFDDFNAPFLDRSRWRDATPGVRVIDGALSLRANGEKVLTQDYFQAKDSSFIVRVDKLPLFEGELFIGLTNEHDIIPDDVFGGTNEFDSFRRHRDIGFRITRYQRNGRTVTEIYFQCYGQSFTGPTIRQRSIAYIPDDPNYPSPMKWLRLDIDPGRNGGATWYTGPNGVNWDERYDVHGGKVNSVTSIEIVDGQPVETTQFQYEDADDFFLFDRDLLYPDQTEWKGHMRVLIQASNGSALTDARLDNVNVLPQGVGTDVDILAKPARVNTSTSNEYLIYALTPRVYSSAQDIQISAVEARASVRMPTPPEPVYIFTGPAQALGDMQAPSRAGDALPVAVEAPVASGGGSMAPPTASGQAQDKTMVATPATAYFLAHAPEVSTDQSSPAPTSAPTKRIISLKTRKVRVTVTQN